MTTGINATTLLTASAAALSGLALYNIYRSRKAEYEHPPRGRFVTVNGVRIHYFQSGHGAPPVVLLHGNLVTAEDFIHSGVFNLVSTRRCVYAFDRPGFGYSDRPRGSAWGPAAQAELFRATFRALGIERPIVLGHSWGVLPALGLALKYPHEVRGLVLVSGYYFPAPRLDVPLFSPNAIPVAGDVLRYTISPLVGAAMLPLIVNRMFAPDPVPASFVEELPHQFSLRPSQIRAENQDTANMIPAVLEMRHHYAALKTPMVLMSGTEDRIVKFSAHTLELHKRIPGSILGLIPNHGHMLHYVAPEQVAEAVDTIAARSVRPGEFSAAA